MSNYSVLESYFCYEWLFGIGKNCKREENAKTTNMDIHQNVPEIWFM